MKKVCLFMILLSLGLYVNAQEMYWTTMMNVLPSNHGLNIHDEPIGNVSVVDKWGNIYVAANGSVTKYNNSGGLVWTENIGGQNYSVDADTLGYIYVTGFAGAIRKLDSSGMTIWMMNIGTVGTDIEVDENGNVFVAGSTGVTPDLDPGPGVFPVDTAGAMLVKLDGAGNFLWAYVHPGSGFIEQSYYNAVSLDHYGNAYVAGQYGSISVKHGYRQKVTAEGNVAWTVEHQSSGILGDDLLDITVSDSNYVYVIGLYNYDPDQGGEYFIQKLDTAGNQIWRRNLNGGSAHSRSAAIVVDDAGSVYVNATGGCEDYDPGPGVVWLEGWGFPGSFLMKLTASGIYEWASTYKFPYPAVMGRGVYGYNIAVDNNCDVYVTSVVESDINVDVDPGAGTYNLTGEGIFIQKIGCSAAGVNNVGVQVKNVMVHPNPTSGVVNISSSETIHSILIIDVMGSVVYEAMPERKQYEMLPDIADGLYHVKITTDAGSVTEKIVMSR